MKILAIRGKNLASLEGEFEISFTEEPLKSAGIFAITGSTGAGKSTLLDALCLALFDATPRMSKARENNVLVPDVADRQLSQNDSRIILRRGTAEGYAEVDFRALDGHDYRSRWMVRRSRGQVYGSLQKVEMRLTDLTAGGVEVGGTKTELLAKIAGLIGLSFEQFSRSVLLAQGDFATFLKARQSEKAEILEKLTGTEIYSRISASIYEHWRQAKTGYEQLKAKMQDVVLLSGEELEKLMEEDRTLDDVIRREQTERDRQKARLQWLNEQERMLTLLREAMEQRAAADEAYEKAAPRFRVQEEWEQAQSIRESYVQEQRCRELAVQLAGQLESLRREETTLSRQLTELQAAKEKADAELAAYKEELQALRPRFDEAHRLDARLEEIRKQVLDAASQRQQASVEVEKREKELADLARQQAEAEQQDKLAAEWLDKYKSYETLIPKVDLIGDLIRNIRAAREMRASNERLLTENRQLLAEEQERLTVLQQEAQRLDALLPAEIATLRARLVEGEPCPVCGSLHHPLTGTGEAPSLQEEELNRAKEQNNRSLTLLQEAIARHTNELSRLTALIETYTRQAEEGATHLASQVALLPDWKQWLEEGKLEHYIRKFVSQWNERTQRRHVIQEGLAKVKSRLEALSSERGARREELNRKVAAHVRLEQTYAQVKADRATLFGGQSVKQLQQKQEQHLKDLEAAAQKMAAEVQQCLSRLQHCKGNHEQLVKEQARTAELQAGAVKQIEEWLHLHPALDGRNALDRLFARDADWYRQEKEALEKLKELRTSRMAVCEERRQSVDKHLSDKNRPEDGVTAEQQTELIRELESQLEVRNKRKLELHLTLETHKKNEKQLAHYRKELEQQEEVYINWAKLNDLFGSQTGSKFKEIAQGYTLDILVAYANKHLEELSKRYLLQRIPDTLALQVIDQDMLGEVRTVHSLSGGESFLVSLALALGLASLSSNRMNVESLFIDEGFGSLDLDTLRVAMEALESLQTQGRKIGVISHVPEMTERITTQIRVVKEDNGKSRIEVVVR